jgi:hypothetical protein
MSLDLDKSILVFENLCLKELISQKEKREKENMDFAREWLPKVAREF